jgi:hypothetical protein
MLRTDSELLIHTVSTGRLRLGLVTRLSRQRVSRALCRAPMALSFDHDSFRRRPTLTSAPPHPRPPPQRSVQAAEGGGVCTNSAAATQAILTSIASSLNPRLLHAHGSLGRLSHIREPLSGPVCRADAWLLRDDACLSALPACPWLSWGCKRVKKVLGNICSPACLRAHTRHVQNPHIKHALLPILNPVHCTPALLLSPLRLHVLQSLLLHRLHVACTAARLLILQPAPACIDGRAGCRRSGH